MPRQPKWKIQDCMDLAKEKGIRIIIIPYKYQYNKPEEMRQYLKNQLINDTE